MRGGLTGRGMPRFANLRTAAEADSEDRRALRAAREKRLSNLVISACWVGMLGLALWAAYGLLAAPLARSIVEQLDAASLAPSGFGN